MSKLKKFVILLAFLVVIFPISVYGYFYYKLSTIHDSSINSDLLDNNDHKNENGITNILLMGTDARPNEDSSRSDAMMILTIDNKHNDIKLTSLARDSYVDIPGHGKQKLTHAYAYGQADLLIQTIEENFNVDIQNYACVNFESFMYIIDAIGGVEVTIEKGEISELNKFIPETYGWNKSDDKGSIQYIRKSGAQTLNGYQALSFARIRHNDTAFARDGRQREIIQAIIKKTETLPVTKYPGLLDAVLPYVKTNMKPNAILSLGAQVLKMGDLNVKQFEFPIDDEIHSTGGIYGKAGWVLRFDPDTLDILHDFIFNDIEFKQ
ncbi:MULTISPECIES: LCP family protein [unclassified Clostridioides]|uniref:LCP family protein n=1 Tax=unclassified Clostridioides TaxID=2635829 RepID=UPI001D105B42|nr:LCP family protein [Clostridioides sp. ES-S-0049-03]MCC0655699.1 LCP family protein [Clostridioides sp. ES-S-0123-01]MCC0676620.1 LCP family protein [Clostridioides sp. ES-W-0018-02]MCC0706161.1 LCP family protein [Clostridioides sp. ES-S-0190-01]MCC0711179.1 LCP family protein [Clostridioides sp. ES-W-0017-02]UDN61149.1 LCP family protein [Clostridioides sp. ES-W-0016-02]